VASSHSSYTVLADQTRRGTQRGYRREWVVEDVGVTAVVLGRLKRCVQIRQSGQARRAGCEAVCSAGVVFDVRRPPPTANFATDGPVTRAIGPHMSTSLARLGA